METKKEYTKKLEDMRVSLRHFYCVVIPEFNLELLKYAEELDKSYKDVKISKVAGQVGCVVGGALSVVGFALSFATFGTSLGLVIAGGVIGGAGGVTTGGASVGELIQAKKARDNTQKQLKKCELAFSLVLEKCVEVSNELKHIGDIDTEFPTWVAFWSYALQSSRKIVVGAGWNIVGSTIISTIRLAKGIDVAGDAASHSIPLFRTMGAASKGLHVFGGVVSSVFLPIDVALLVYDVHTLHKDTAHEESLRIRKIVKEIRDTFPTEKQIDAMIETLY